MAFYDWEPYVNNESWEGLNVEPLTDKKINPAPTHTELAEETLRQYMEWEQHGDHRSLGTESDMVKQPGHYKIFPDEEVIDLIKKCLTKEEFIGYCKGNILKYRLRDKNDIVEDFSKSKEYKRYLQELETS